MAALVEQYLVTMVVVVALADDDMAHPTAGSNIVSMAVDGDAVFHITPQTSLADVVVHTDKLP